MDKKKEAPKKKRMAFGQFAQQPHIKGLCMAEKKKRYQIYVR